MDYQYMNTIQISNLDYWTLVNMLMNQITPETRKKILERLTEMNNQLMIGSCDAETRPIAMQQSTASTAQLLGSSWQASSQIQPDLARSSMLNPRKIDATEIQHPSIDHLNYKGANPLPLNIPINNNQFNVSNPYHAMTPNIAMGQIPQMVMPINCNVGQQRNNITHEIDLDDIIDELHGVPDELDEKLAKIKKLHTKIITEKRRRRKERDNK